jgi:hypothetical protein
MAHGIIPFQQALGEPFSPGVLPILAGGVTYVGIAVLGHAVMRLVAGPAKEGLDSTRGPFANEPGG